MFAISDHISSKNIRIVLLGFLLVVLGYARGYAQPFQLPLHELRQTSVDGGPAWLADRINIMLNFENVVTTKEALFVSVQLQEQILSSPLLGETNCSFELSFSRFNPLEDTRVFIELRKRTLFHEIEGELIASGSFSLYDAHNYFFTLQPSSIHCTATISTIKEDSIIYRPGPDVSEVFEEYYTKFEANPDYDGFKQRYPQSSKYYYLLIKGFFCDFYGNAYMKDNRAVLDELGLRYAYAPLNTQQTQEVNAKIIADSVKDLLDQGEEVILFAHSKGSLDVMMAFVAYPEIMNRVSRFISIQGTYAGTFIPDLLDNFAGDVLGEILHIMGGNKSTIKQMSHSYVHDTLIKHIGDIPPPSVQTLSLGSMAYFNDTGVFGPIVDTVMRPLMGVVKYWRGFVTDGLVAMHDARIPGAQSIFIAPCSHADTTFPVRGSKYQPAPLTEALLAILFDE